MCPKPNIPTPQRLQASQEAVYSDGNRSTAATTGRRGTILTGGAGGDSGLTPTQVTGKKTLLGV